MVDVGVVAKDILHQRQMGQDAPARDGETDIPMRAGLSVDVNGDQR